MFRLLDFFKRYYVLILFLVLQSIAINYYARSSSYTRAKVLTFAGTVTGGVNESMGDVGSYFRLAKDNRSLIERIAELENELTAYRVGFNDSLGTDGREILEKYLAESPYCFYTAKVVDNSITQQHNYFIINKGTDDGIAPNMAVMTIDGSVAGYVEACTDHLSVCMSVLNTGFKLGGRVKGKDFKGSVNWDGRNHRIVKLTELPRYADVRVGDSVVSIYSKRFPSDSYIGKVVSIGYSDDNSFYKIDVELAADMSRLKDVVVVRYEQSEELEELSRQISELHY